MSNQNDYVPVQLIIKIGNRLLAVDGLGHQVYSARYLEKNHLSSRAQHHFRHHESVSVMQLYAAIRILLLNTSSVWERILQICRILDILEQCFCECYSGVTLHPFEGGMEKIVREKMLSVAGYDFGAVISDVGDWKMQGG